MFEALLRAIAAAVAAALMDEATAAQLRTTIETLGTEDRSGITADDLAAVEPALLQLFDQIRAGEIEGVSADDLEALREIGDVVETARGEITTRETQAAEREAEIAELETRIRPVASGDDEEETETTTETEEEETSTSEETEESAQEPEAVMAGGRPSLAALARSAPAGTAPVPTAPRSRMRIVGPNGEALQSIDQLAAASASAFDTARGARVLAPSKQPLGRVFWDLPEAQKLHGERGDDEKIEALTAAAQNPPEAIVASGGFCAPADVDYTVPVVGATDRPVANGAPSVELTRGALQVSNPPTLADIDTFDGIDANAAVTVWTNTDDEAAPGAGDTKGFQRIDCATFTEYELAAIVRRLRWGNFGSRALPENVEAWNRLVMVAHARLAETRLLDQIKAGSIQRTTPQVFGAARDIVEAVKRARQQIISVHRMDDDTRFRVRLPEWAPTLGDVDLLRGLQSDPGFVREGERIFRDALDSAGVSVTLYKDSPSTGTSQILGYGAGPVLAEWPCEIQWNIAPEAYWLFGSQAQLDLGVYFSPDLNDTNDVENFAETFEVMIPKGMADSLWITSSVLADGTSAAGIDGAVTCGS